MHLKQNIRLLKYIINKKTNLHWMHGYIKLSCLNQGIHKSLKCNNFTCIDSGKTHFTVIYYPWDALLQAIPNVPVKSPLEMRKQTGYNE